MNHKNSQTIDSLLGIKRPQFKNCIGIYISLTDIYVAQIEEKSGGIEVGSLVKLSLQDVRADLLRPSDLNEGFFATPKHWLEPIKKIIDSKEWSTKDVVISLSPHFSVHRHFVISDVPRYFWHQTIPLQARKYIHYPFERAIYDFSVRPFYSEITKSKQLEVVFSLTSKIIVSTLETGMKSIGLNLASVETSPLSIFRLFNQTDKEAQKGVGQVYANFSSYEGQFLFAINNTPVLLREVEINPSMGTRNRLEVNNCIDFISKQIEKNVFEDIVVVSEPSQMDWKPLLEMETKKNVRKWNIEDIFGFKVSGFAEIAAMGACLKFINDEVPDIDLARKYSSSKEEIDGTFALWRITMIIIAILLMWGVFIFISSAKAYMTFQKQKISMVSNIQEFTDLTASQIKERVATMKQNNTDLSALIIPPKYTPKLSALPDLISDETSLKSLNLSYPMVSKSGRKRNNISMTGIIYSLEGSKAELIEGNKLSNRLQNSAVMFDLCKEKVNISYPSEKGGGLGTDFKIVCNQN